MPDTGGVQGQGSAPASQIAQFRSDGFTSTTGLRVPFFSDAFSRAFGLPDVRLVNMISEATPLREERPYVPFVGLREVRYSRPGMVTGFNWGTGPMRGAYCNGGVFGGALFAVSGTGMFMNGVGVGTIPGTDLVKFAASPLQIVCVASGVAYVYDGVTYPAFTAIANGVLPAVVDVAYLAGRFAYIAQDSNVWWYSELNDATSVLGLDFNSQQDSPSDCVAVDVLNDELIIFSQDVLENWSPGTTDAEPFAPNEGQGYRRGCINRNSIAFCDNALFWLGDNGVVYRTGGSAPQRVSSSTIEDAIRQCDDISAITAFDATFEGHEFYVLNLPDVGTFAYDISRIGSIENAYGSSYERGEWQEWRSWNWPQFRARFSVTYQGDTYVGDDTTNDLWLMEVGAWTDGPNPLVRQASAFIKIEEGRPRMDGLVLHGVQGTGNAVAPGVDPVVEMRYSDDLGRTFSRWRAASLGARGVYAGRVYWQRLGLMRAPGRLIQVRCSDPVDVAWSHLELNPLRPAN